MDDDRLEEAFSLMRCITERLGYRFVLRDVGGYFHCECEHDGFWGEAHHEDPMMAVSDAGSVVASIEQDIRRITSR